MAYSAVTDPEIAIGKPVSNALLTKYRDNMLAIPAGLAGAPKMQNAAIATDAVQSAQIQANAVGSSEIAADAVRFASEVWTPSDDVVLNAANGAGTVIPAGVYNLGDVLSSAITAQIYCGPAAGWVAIAGPVWPMGTGLSPNIQITSDGVSCRLVSTAPTATMQARRIAG